MLLIILVLSVLGHAVSHPATCTEDTQCSTGFYCEKGVHTCRECLRCADLKREAPQPRDSCVRTVVHCGPCFKGHVRRNAECVLAEGGAPAPYLPASAWVAVGAGLLLMLLMLCVFLKMKTFKVIDYSSRTSVQSVRASGSAEVQQPLAPPPYNCIPPPAFAPMAPLADAPEIQRLVDSPEPCKRPPLASAASGAREPAATQAARVYNHPSYVRVPPTLARLKSPEESPSPEGTVHGSPVAQTDDVTPGSAGEANALKLYNDLIPINVSEDEMNNGAHGKKKDEDSNNNQSSSEGRSSARGPRAQCGGACVIGGPSFIINVVENVNNGRQRNEATFCRS